MTTRQQLEQQLVAAHRSGNVQAAQQAAYNIRAYDTAIARGGSGFDWNVPSVNAPPPIERVPKPTFGDYFEDISRGMGRGFVTQLEGMQQLVTHPYDTGKALIQAGVEAVRNPAQAIGEAWSGIKSQAQTAMSSPEGFGRVLGENLDFIPGPGGKRRPTMAELDVYHGTPHTFEAEEGAPLGRFRSSKIGTGEGAQAYGYGLYLAEKQSTAQNYKETLVAKNDNKITLDGEVVDPRSILGESLENLKKLGRQATIEKLDRYLKANEPYEHYNYDIAFVNQQYRNARNEINTIDESRVSFNEGSLYKVDLPDAKIEQMLDWDKRLSEQPKIVRDAFAKAFSNPEIADDELMAWYRDNPNPTGNALYSQLMTSDRFTGHGQKEASRVLSELGIPGIKYLDAGSRAGEKGTRNFVVFPGEEQHLTILDRDGVKAEVPKADAPKVRQFSPASLASVKVGGKVDGYTVRADVPNTDSIGATLDDYEVLSGIRSVPMSDFDPDYVRSISLDKLDARTRRLADEIQQSKELSPMIVAYDAEGPYIIEGGHRFDALIASKAKSIPAVVVIDKSNPPK